MAKKKRQGKKKSTGSRRRIDVHDATVKPVPLYDSYNENRYCLDNDIDVLGKEHKCSRNGDGKEGQCGYDEREGLEQRLVVGEGTAGASKMPEDGASTSAYVRHPDGVLQEDEEEAQGSKRDVEDNHGMDCGDIPGVAQNDVHGMDEVQEDERRKSMRRDNDQGNEEVICSSTEEKIHRVQETDVQLEGAVERRHGWDSNDVYARVLTIIRQGYLPVMHIVVKKFVKVVSHMVYMWVKKVTMGLRMVKHAGGGMAGWLGRRGGYVQMVGEVTHRLVRVLMRAGVAGHLIWIMVTRMTEGVKRYSGVIGHTALKNDRHEATAMQAQVDAPITDAHAPIMDAKNSMVANTIGWHVDIPLWKLGTVRLRATWKGDSADGKNAIKTMRLDDMTPDDTIQAVH